MTASDAPPALKGLYYRLSQLTDPEERLEDAALWKAMHDTYGAGITLWPDTVKLPKDGLIFGRTRRYEGMANFAGQSQVYYAKDKAFLAGISRAFWLCDIDQAQVRVRELHADGKAAFVKAVDQKRMILRLPVGSDLMAEMGDDVWSFLDRPPCLMVQEFMPMRNERRFVVMDRKIVTESPVATHLTPLSRYVIPAQTGIEINDLHFKDPTGTAFHADPLLSARMRRVVQRTAAAADLPNLIIDVCEMENGSIELIEFNPCRPGMFGLFACDPYAVAEASKALIPDDLMAIVARRRAQNDPIPEPTADEPDEAAEDGGVADEPWSDFAGP